MPESPQIKMPEFADKIKKETNKQALAGFYENCGTKQWFWQAEVIENHPTHFKDTLVIYCKYNPVLEMKEILEFVDKYSLALDIVPISHEG